MKRLWFVEGMDAVGKTTVMRELLNRSGHRISGVMDRGPLSRIVWAKEENLLGEINGWLTWFREAKYVVGVLLLLSDWSFVRETLEKEGADPHFQGVRWTEAEWVRMQENYISYAMALTTVGVRVYTIPSNRDLNTVLNQCSWVMGYQRDILTTPAANPVGQREAPRDNDPA